MYLLLSSTHIFIFLTCMCIFVFAYPRVGGTLSLLEVWTKSMNVPFAFSARGNRTRLAVATGCVASFAQTFKMSDSHLYVGVFNCILDGLGFATPVS